MRAIYKKSIGALGAAIFAMVAFNNASATVVGSFHDLSPLTGNTDAVCVFCHTPHGGDTSFAAVPLWNKVLNAPGAYTRYSSLLLPTLDGAEAPVGSVSIACLSCHDGTQAMDVVINLPGSYGYNPAGTEIDVGAIGMMGSPPVRNLGTDLTNDHPISIQYAGGGCDDGDPDGTCPGPLGDPDFNFPEKTTINGNPVWWVDTSVGVAGVREKTDLPLYARSDVVGSVVIEPTVECGSCHDPHDGQNTGGPGSVQFLRISNAGSEVCITCHIK
jgi:hypothetical protein